MRVVLTEAALDDLFAIGRTIAQEAPGRAGTFVDELYERCLRLGDMPQAYPLLPGWEDKGVRRRVHGSYLISCRIGLDTIDILHVLHGGRDDERILFPDE